MSLLRNLPVARKFLLSFSIVCTLCALTVWIALTGMSRNDQAASILVNIALPSAQNLANMQSSMQIYRGADMGILACDAGDCIEYYVKTRIRTMGQFADAYKAYAASGADAEERNLAYTVEADFSSYRLASDPTLALLQAGNKALAAQQTVGPNALIFRHADSTLNKAIEANTRISPVSPTFTTHRQFR